MRTGVLSILATCLALFSARSAIPADPPLPLFFTEQAFGESFESICDGAFTEDSFFLEQSSDSLPGMTWRVRGRIDTDAIWSAQDQQNLATFGDLNDVVGLRRARIGLEGEFGSIGRYVGEIDLATGDVVIRDLFAAYRRSDDLFEIRAGHFREPFSLEGNTSANSFAFMERSVINTLDPSRNWGLGYFSWNEQEDATFAIGLFHSGTGPSDLQGGDGDDSALTARWTMLPYHQQNRLMHLGVVLSSRIPVHGIVLVNQQPPSPLLDVGDSSSTPFIPELRIPADFQQLFNLQWAMQEQQLTLQAEWYGSWINQTGGPPILLHGSYLQASYFLPGGSRAYAGKQGGFGAVHVERPVTRHFSSQASDETLGLGAWEWTARLAYLDFADTDLPPGPSGEPPGVELLQATLGVNWYLTDRVRILFNYSLAAPTEPISGQSLASIFATRLGVFW